jgi:hypothetical protein
MHSRSAELLVHKHTGKAKGKWKVSAIRDIWKTTYLKKWLYLIAYHGNEIKIS